MDWILKYYLRLMANGLLLNFRANVLNVFILRQWNGICLHILLGVALYTNY